MIYGHLQSQQTQERQPSEDAAPWWLNEWTSGSTNICKNLSRELNFQYPQGLRKTSHARNISLDISDFCFLLISTLHLLIWAVQSHSSHIRQHPCLHRPVSPGWVHVCHRSSVSAAAKSFPAWTGTVKVRTVTASRPHFTASSALEVFVSCIDPFCLLQAV